MIYKINNDELFNLSSSIGENAYLPELSKNFISRLGIKMISEDGNNTLQGFGAFDMCKEDSGEITYKIIKIYVSPEFNDTNYKDVILEHLCKYAKEEAFGHITLTNKNDDQNNLVTTDHNNDVKEITESTENKLLENIHNEISEEKTEIPLNNTLNDIKINILTDESEISDLIEYLSELDKAAELPNRNKHSIGLKAFTINSSDGYPIAILVEDIFETAKGKFIKIMNVFVTEENRKKHFATKLLHKSIKDFNENNYNNLFISCVGTNKEILSSILQSLKFNFDGNSRGKINYYL